MRVICFDIGATDVKYGVVEDGTLIFRSKTETEAEKGRIYFENKLISITSDLLSKYQVDGIGVSCAGSIDYNTGIILIPSDNAKKMGNINFKQLFHKAFKLECLADNDVNCFAMAENCGGYGKIFDNFVVMTIGSGIGGGIIIHDVLWRGVNFNGGEIGRMLVRDGQKYEATASVNALLEMTRKAGLNYHNALEIFDAYDRGDEAIKPIIKKFYENISYGLANIIYIMNPETVIIGGGISNRSTLADEIKAELKNFLHEDFYKTIDIRNAYFKNDGGMIGAYYNFVRDHKRNEE